MNFEERGGEVIEFWPFGVHLQGMGSKLKLEVNGDRL